MSKTWASDDDAERLLAGILDETEDVARAEKERLDAEFQARQEAEQQQAAELERIRREEAEARLSAERDRIERAEARRTQKMEALRIEDLKERGEWVDPEEVAREEARVAAEREAERELARQERAREHAERLAAERARLAPEPAPGNSSALMAVTAMLFGAVIASGVLIATLIGGYEPDSATYSKSVFMPKETELAMIEAGYTPIPVVEEAAEAKEVRAKSPTTRTRPATSTPSKVDKKDDAAKRAEELRKMLENSDSIFGE